MKIVIARFDDWHGIYVDGKLKYENHSIPYFEIFNAIGMEFEEVDIDMADLDWGRYPETEEELRKVMETIDD